MFIRIDIKPFEDKIWLASPTMHGEELEYIHDAFEKTGDDVIIWIRFWD